MTPQEILAQYGPREAMEYDVVIVGGGPGGMATAIRLKQVAATQGREISVVVLEKGSEPGAHAYATATHCDGVVAPSLTVVVPRGQGRQTAPDVAASADEYLPRGHGVQPPLPVAFARNDPAAHGEHAVSPASEKKPSAHATHALAAVPAA